MAKNLLIDLEDYKSFTDRQLATSDNWRESVEGLVRATSEFLKSKWLYHIYSISERYSELRFYFIGSYLRQEASLYSDLDMFVEGDKHLSEEFLQEIHLQGLPIRARHLEDLSVESLDPYSMMSLVQMSEQTKDLDPFGLLDIVAKDALNYLFQQKMDFLGSMEFERKKRWHNYDSISNYLEPNLKYQPGGLRDIEQGIFLLLHFCHELPLKEREVVQSSLEEFRWVLSYIRQICHREISGDILLASVQQEVATRLGFEKHREFMSYVQSVCEESFFLCQWVFQVSKVGKIENSEKPLDHIRSCLENIEWQSDSRHLKIIRDDLLEKKISRKDLIDPSFLSFVNKALWSLRVEVPWFLYQSKLLDLILPEYSRVRSLVQHDQYHRYTVAAHSIVCVRNSFLLAAGKIPLKNFSSVLSELDRQDWSILFYTALFHDLGKGQEREHSLVGEDLARVYLKELSQKEALIDEVAWMVRNHLLFSKAAFRTNMQESSVFDYLDKLQLSPKRIRNLSLFTLIDISSSNPEALTSWKEDLLFELYQKLSRPGLRSDDTLKQRFYESLGVSAQNFLPNLDFDIISMLTDDDFIKELEFLKEAKFVDSFKVYQTLGPYLLIRYVSEHDTKGLLASLLGNLLGMGLSIFKVNANTIDGKVYDWFQISSPKGVAWVEKMLRSSKLNRNPSKPELDVAGKIIVQKIEGQNFIARIEGSLLNPLLFSFCNYLSRSNVDIYWLRIHKWGRQNEITAGVSKEVATLEQFSAKKLF